LDGYLRQGEPQLMDHCGEEMALVRALFLTPAQGFAINGDPLQGSMTL
jgi:hypothetical protein